MLVIISIFDCPLQSPVILGQCWKTDLRDKKEQISITECKLELVVSWKGSVLPGRGEMSVIHCAFCAADHLRYIQTFRSLE